MNSLTQKDLWIAFCTVYIYNGHTKTRKDTKRHEKTRKDNEKTRKDTKRHEKTRKDNEKTRKDTKRHTKRHNTMRIDTNKSRSNALLVSFRVFSRFSILKCCDHIACIVCNNGKHFVFNIPTGHDILQLSFNISSRVRLCHSNSIQNEGFQSPVCSFTKLNTELINKVENQFLNYDMVYIRE